jgi:hypothetical protein
MVTTIFAVGTTINTAELAFAVGILVVATEVGEYVASMFVGISVTGYEVGLDVDKTDDGFSDSISVGVVVVTSLGVVVDGKREDGSNVVDV